MRAGRAAGPRAQPQPQRGRSATYAPCKAPLPPPFFSVRNLRGFRGIAGAHLCSENDT
jgi:hypothetical protein